MKKIYSFFNKLKKAFSRSEWIIKLFSLDSIEGKEHDPGLLMIQVDGLSKNQLLAAIKNNRMPFLKSLLKNTCSLNTFYSGLPSATPAVQAELFYGIKTAVPSFSFLDDETGDLFRMYDPVCAATIQKRLMSQCDRPLLKGGSSYSNIYSGGAHESHFCFSEFGFSKFYTEPGTFKVIFLFITNIYMLLRVSVLLCMEAVLAVYDFFVGTFKGCNFISEFKTIPARVMICILLRELIVLSVRTDLIRGLPVIHNTLVGYDEQSHRRGPSSMFAHWTLKGIDDSIKRMYKSAQSSQRRNYTVWIYSDHGQTSSQSFFKIYDNTPENTFSSLIGEKDTDERDWGIQNMRAGILTFFNNIQHEKEFPVKNGLKFVQMGPVGHVYLSSELFKKRESIAEKIIKDLKIGCAFIKNGEKIRVLTNHGEYLLPDDKESFFAKDQSFKDVVCEDLIRQVMHSSAGDIMVYGGRLKNGIMTFPSEKGSHAGYSPEEIKGFFLAPSDMEDLFEKPFLRPIEIRESALAFLDSGHAGLLRKNNKNNLRVMTYNIHGCVGTDGKHSLERVASVISNYHPDIVCLQETDSELERSEFNRHAEQIAEILEMSYYFHPSFNIKDGQYGNAILSHLPLNIVKSGILTPPHKKYKCEPRGVLWAEVDFNGKKINIFNTHLGFRKHAQFAQIESLIGKEWLGNPKIKGPVILCGDFNSGPHSKVFKKITSNLSDTSKLLKNKKKGTWNSLAPFLKLDHIFVDSEIETISIRIGDMALDRRASDHLPLIADLKIKERND